MQLEFFKMCVRTTLSQIGQINSSSWPSSGPTALGKRRRELRGSVCVPDGGGGKWVWACVLCVWCACGCVCVCVCGEVVVEDAGEAGTSAPHTQNARPHPLPTTAVWNTNAPAQFPPALAQGRGSRTGPTAAEGFSENT